jgi:dihydropteroate synthase
MMFLLLYFENTKQFGITCIVCDKNIGYAKTIDEYKKIIIEHIEEKHIKKIIC